MKRSLAISIEVNIHIYIPIDACLSTIAFLVLISLMSLIAIHRILFYSIIQLNKSNVMAVSIPP